MRKLRRSLFSLIAGTLLSAPFASNMAGAVDSTGPLGIFSNQGDVGSVSRPVIVACDAATKTYTIGASGANMWGAEDAFGFVWKQVTGDIALAADIGLMGSSNQGHRKACLVFRQTLDAGSAYADVAVHGDGHIALQFRSSSGLTRTIQGPGKCADARAPGKTRVVRHLVHRGR